MNAAVDLNPVITAPVAQLVIVTAASQVPARRPPPTDCPKQPIEKICTPTIVISNNVNFCLIFEPLMSLDFSEAICSELMYAIIPKSALNVVRKSLIISQNL